MKIAIVTYYGENSNYGAFYQALGLSEYLKKNGNNKVVFYGRKELDETGDKSKYTQKRRKYLSLARSQYFSINYDNDTRYDLAVLGSDQIWYDKKPYFYGRGINADKIISYAPSVGNLMNSKVWWKNLIKKVTGPIEFQKWKEDLKRLDGISVRDVQTAKLVKKVANIEPNIVLDPTFLIDWNDYFDPCPVSDDFILIYSYELSEKDESIQQIAKKLHYKVVAVNYENPRADYNDAYTPGELLSLFKNAKIVFTDTFHGTVFSIIFKKVFLVFAGGVNTKPVMFLKQLGIKNRVVETPKDMMNCIKTNIDYENVYARIERLRQDSKNYLAQYIEKN